MNQHTIQGTTGNGPGRAAGTAGPTGTAGGAAARPAVGQPGQAGHPAGKAGAEHLRGGWQVYAAGVVICAALSGVAYVAGIQSAQAEYAAHQADGAELKARQKKAATLARDLAAAQESLDRTLREVAQLPLRLEPATAINLRLAQLDKLCEGSNLRIDERRPGPTIDHPHYQTVTINLVGTGTYPACAMFLHELRKRFPDTAVRSFESSNPSPGRHQSTGTFRIELVWYTAPAAK